MRGRSSTALAVGVALVLASVRVPAEEVASSAGTPVVEESVVDGVVTVSGTFEVPASASIVWNVLSDYEHITRFVSSLRRSVVRERIGKGLLVEQQAVGKLLFLSRQIRLLLEIQEDEPRRITFRDVSRTDFELYQGSWTLVENSESTTVVYRLTARPKVSLPSFLSSSAFRSSASGLLAEVRAEMVRRAAQSNQAMDGCNRPQKEGKLSCR